MNKVKQVLLIDDDLIVNLINTRVIQLTDPDMKVSSVTNGCEALQRLRGIPDSGVNVFPDLIFIDINMPEMDGWEFLTELKHFPEGSLSNCSFIMLTSSIDLFDIQKAKKNPIVDDYLIKPLNIEMFKSLLSSAHPC
eukprot:Opistho-1_new@40131